ncbi:uncharacterized protein LOC106011327 [Aplysia californica]|uniref:Uncharacterized protein LOC106011327 n=1 Tax=Aplysia californica TaxID=6500 RepID=A0ABM0ZWJ4_APLCA|nr:uncharacterized protein LOC106011327 [Aplysia californica]
MNYFTPTVALAIVLLAGFSMAQDPAPAGQGQNCRAGCQFFCDTIAKGCVDVPPVVTCASNVAACSAQCDSSCDCFEGCTANCQSLLSQCQMGAGNPVLGILCKSQITLCVSSCPAICAGQSIISNIQQLLQQSLGGLVKSLNIGLPGLQ